MIVSRQLPKGSLSLKKTEDMKVLIILLFVICTLGAYAQDEPIFNQLLKDYKSEKMSYTQLDFDLFELYMKKQPSATEEHLKDILKGIENVNVLQFEIETKNEQVFDDISARYEKIGWTKFRESRNIPYIYSILLNKKQKNIKGIVYLGFRNKKFMLLEFLGNNIDLTKLAELSKYLNIKGADQLKVLAQEPVKIKIVDDSRVMRITGISTLKDGKNPLVILDGIVVNDALKDVDPKEIESVSILKGKSAMVMYGELGRNGVILVTRKKKNSEAKAPLKLKGTISISPQIVPVYVVDGKLIRSFDDIDIEKVKSIEIYSPTVATAIYGSSGQNGAILFNTKETIANKMPLIIVDGFELPLSSNMDKLAIADEDIKSVVVIKDRENLKIYGEKAKHGVIIIRTKNPQLIGKQFHKTNFSLIFNDSQVYVINLYDRNLPKFIINNKGVSNQFVRTLSPDKIKMVKMWSKEDVFMHGMSGRVVEIILKNSTK